MGTCPTDCFFYFSSEGHVHATKRRFGTTGTRFLNEGQSAITHVKDLLIVVLAPDRLTGYTNVITTFQTILSLLCKLAHHLTAIELTGIVVLILEVGILSIADAEGSDLDGSTAVARWQFFKCDRRSTLLTRYLSKQSD